VALDDGAVHLEAEPPPLRDLDDSTGALERLGRQAFAEGIGRPVQLEHSSPGTSAKGFGGSEAAHEVAEAEARVLRSRKPKREYSASPPEIGIVSARFTCR
jgi:hypothetical protein